MPKSITRLGEILADLTRFTRERGLNDSQWAAAAGLPKETLSRLRRRESCDFATLSALSSAVGAKLGVTAGAIFTTTVDGHFPKRIDRDYEARLLNLVASRNVDPGAWRANGPGFFMAGIAVMTASMAGMDRHSLLVLAETLHPGSSRPEVFDMWLARSPVRPSRFLPLVRA